MPIPACFCAFPNPRRRNYDNTAFVGVDFGFEVQIDQLAAPDGLPIHKTAAIYGFQGPDNPNALPVNAVGEWNEFEIRVQGQNYTVTLNGVQVTDFNFVPGSDAAHPDRGLPSTNAVPRFIGLQTHTGRVAFRKIQIEAAVRRRRARGADYAKCASSTSRRSSRRLIYGGLGTAVGGLVARRRKRASRWPCCSLVRRRRTVVPVAGAPTTRADAAGNVGNRNAGIHLVHASHDEPSTRHALVASWRPDVLHLHVVLALAAGAQRCARNGTADRLYGPLARSRRVRTGPGTAGMPDAMGPAGDLYRRPI